MVGCLPVSVVFSVASPSRARRIADSVSFNRYFLIGLVCLFASPCLAQHEVDFARDVAPILEKRCLLCHRSSDPQGELSLSTVNDLNELGYLEPGKPEASHLLKVVNSSGGKRPQMPKSGDPLSPAQIDVLTRWIKSGAKWPVEMKLPRLWSLAPLSRPAVPDQADGASGVSSAAQSPIDRFVRHRLQAEGLQPAAPASRAELIRRLKFDLLGLPPTADEIDAFVADAGEDAFSRLVDRYLASPLYGERWGRHWLDVVRFGESDGFEDDDPRYHAWPYRDYVIRSLNEDKPYDQFVREQLAGDAIEPVTAEGRIATTLLVNGPFDRTAFVSASKTEQLRAREETLEEMLTTIGQTFLGLTVNCARCHDHKFDPIPQADYYRMKAVFEGVHQSFNSRFEPTPILNAAEAAEYEKLQAQLKTLGTDAANAQAVAEVKRQIETFPRALIGHRQQPGPTVLFERGDIRSPGATVVAGALSAVHQQPADLGLTGNSPEAERRRKFAEWVTDMRNPLTARVIVNRVWQWHFGSGIVDTPSDFGVNGGRPSHLELLDWLASQFIEDGWSLKQLHRRILLSATWQQSSMANPLAAKVDVDNRLLWRFAPQRLDAESTRDAMLFVSGELNSQIGGASYQPFTTTRFNTVFYHPIETGEPNLNRRTIYRMGVNTGRDPLLDALDCPAPSVLTPVRRQTVTPLQALSLMNDTFVLRQAKKLAERVVRESSDSSQQIVLAWRHALGREPNPEEAAGAVAMIRDSNLETLCWVLFNSSEFLQVR